MTLTRLTASACAALWLTAAVAAAADRQIIFVVRHAERADAGSPAAKMMGADPSLSEMGKARADRLAAILRVAQVGHIFTTELRRTRETAAPLAAATHLDIVALPATDVDGLVTRLSAAHGTSLRRGTLEHGSRDPEEAWRARERQRLRRRLRRPVRRGQGRGRGGHAGSVEILTVDGRWSVVDR